MQIHSRQVNKNRRKPGPGQENFLQCLWEGSFNYFENHLGSGKEIFEYYLGRKISEKEKWALYRKVDPRNFFVRWASYLKNVNIISKSSFDKAKGLAKGSSSGAKQE